MEVNENILKISGKVSIPEALKIDTNYSLALAGTITEKREKSNENGTTDVYWIFNPIKCDLLTPEGRTIKGKDTRGLSQRLRSRHFLAWQASHSGMDFPEFHAQQMQALINHWDEVEELLKSIN